MGIPDWLAEITGAYSQMGARGGGISFDGAAPQPTMMDAFRGIGHDMMSHYRQDYGTNGAGPTAAAGGALTPQAPQAPETPGLHYFMGAPASPPSPGGGGMNIGSILKILGQLHGGDGAG